MNLMNLENGMRITSNMVAELTGKKHFIVMRDIRDLIDSIGIEEMGAYVSPSNYTDKANRIKPNYTLTKDGASMLLSRYSDVPQSVYDSIGIEKKVVFSKTRFEISFMDMLEEALGELGISGTRQFVAGGYRIDYYIPSLNIAIEYDEEHHNNPTNIKLDKERQSYITRKLNCKFIRVSYKNSDIVNVVKVIKEVI